MKLVIAIAGLMIVPLVAESGTLRLSWTGCPGTSAAVPGLTFDCDPQAHSTYWLLSSFGLEDTVRGVTSAEGTVDFALTTSGSVPPFWHFESGACNANQLQFRDARPAVACTGVSNTLCGIDGVSCGGLITSYVVGAGGGLPANHARLHFTLPRGTSPVTLASSLNHFGFGLVFSMDNSTSGVCSGCATTAAITWSEITFFDAANVPLKTLTASDPGSEATAFANCTACGVVRLPARTWGLLKSLYR